MFIGRFPTGSAEISFLDAAVNILSLSLVKKHVEFHATQYLPITETFD